MTRMRAPDPSDAQTAAAASFDAAQARRQAGDARGALRLAFEALASDAQHRGALELAAVLSAALGAPRDAALLKAVLDHEQDDQALYELGFALVDAGLPHVGARFLERCAERQPDHPKVRYELAYALFLAGDYDAAEPLLALAARDADLTLAEAFAAALLLVEDRIWRGDLRGARTAFEQAERHEGVDDSDGRLDALARLLARAERLGSGATSDRDRQFVENGGVLLHLRNHGKAPLAMATVTIDFLAGMMRRLQAVLETAGVEPRRAVWVHPAASPLAEAYARFAGIDWCPLAECVDGGEGALVFLREPGEAATALAELRSHAEDSAIFALACDPRREHPIAPEIIGQYATQLLLPWEPRVEIRGSTAHDAVLERFDEQFEPDPRHAENLVEAIESLEGDAGDLAALADYYRPLRDLLVLGNPDAHPMRRMLTARRALRAGDESAP